MCVERWFAVQLLTILAGAVADEWSVLPAQPPAPAKAPPVQTSGEWDVLPDAGPTWSVLEGPQAPPSGNDLCGPLAKQGFDNLCLCVQCDCQPACDCCKTYADVERQALKTGKRVLLAIGVRREEAHAAQREAKARGLLFCQADSLSGIGDGGKREEFPAGVWELLPRPKEGRLYFLPPVERKIPIPDKAPAKAGALKFDVVRQAQER